MTEEQIKDVCRLTEIDLSIIAIKGEGCADGEYQLYTVAVVKEFPAIVIQSEGWKEQDVMDKITKSWETLSHYFLKIHGTPLPKIKDYYFKWVDREEFFK